MAEFNSIADLIAAARRVGVRTEGRSRDTIAADYSRATGQGVVCNFAVTSDKSRGYANPRKK